jgi:hypothetical protein
MTPPAFGDEGPTTTVAPPTSTEINFSTIDSNARLALATNPDAQQLVTIPPETEMTALARREFMPNLINEIANDPVAAARRGGNALSMLTGIGYSEERAQSIILGLAKLYVQQRERLEVRAIRDGYREGTLRGEALAAAFTGLGRTAAQTNNIENGDDTGLVQHQTRLLMEVGEDLSEQERLDMMRAAAQGGFAASAIFAAERIWGLGDDVSIEDAEDEAPNVRAQVAEMIRHNMERDVEELRKAIEAARRAGRPVRSDETVLAAERRLANLVGTRRAAGARTALEGVADQSTGLSPAERTEQTRIVQENLAHQLSLSEELYLHHLRNVVPSRTPRQTFD